MLNDPPNRTELDMVNLDLTAKPCFPTTLHCPKQTEEIRVVSHPNFGKAVVKKQESKGLKAGLLGGPVVKTSPSKAGGVGLIPGWGGVGGTKNPHATGPKNKTKQNKA